MRASEGVRGIKLESSNKVIAMSILKDVNISAIDKEKYLKIPLQMSVSV